VPLLAAAPLPPVVEPVVDPAVDDPPALELAAPALLPPLDAPMPELPADPGVVVPGFAAPISPALVPGPARPALSVSAGEPCAAYAPATAADMQPATTANMSFLITTSRKKLIAATPPLGRGQPALATIVPGYWRHPRFSARILLRQGALDQSIDHPAPRFTFELT
jgi:hypothetical protein